MFLNAKNNTYCWEILHKEFDSVAATLEDLEPEAQNVVLQLNKLENIAKTQKDPLLYARYRYWNAYFNGNRWNTTQNKESKRRYIEETLINIDKLRYDYDYARLVYLSLDIKGEPNGNYLEQYRQLNEILHIFIKYRDLKSEAGCYQLLGILFSELREYGKALEYLEKSDAKFRELEMHKSLVSNQGNKAIVYYYMGHVDTAKETLRNLLNNNLSWKDTNLVISVYNNLSLMTDSLEEQIHCQNTSISVVQSYSGWKRNYYDALIFNNLALRYSQTENGLDSAILLYGKAIKCARIENSHRILLHALSNISDCYAQKGDFVNAYRYMTQFRELQDSVMGSGKIAEINRQEASKAIDEYQQRIKLQDQKIALQKKLSTFTLLVFILIACVLAVILFYLWQKKRLDGIALKNKELKNRQLQQEIDHKNRELSSNMLILSEKKRFLQQVLVQLEKFREKNSLSSSCELALRKMITEHIRSEDEWESFKIHFESVHPDFFGKLKAQYPELTPNDLKLCAYIKIGLSIKQIAQMTAVLPATVKTNRYLLRKKFHLSEEQSLDSFIFNV
ncbi:MAG: hypothetical protein NC324_03680 [Bacteroides sp.]|nr:hypothetical protein [Bacteroides sp.]